MERAGAAVTGFFRQAGAAVANMAGDALATVGANDMAQEAHQAGHDLRATGFEGQAQSSLQKAGSHFKRAFTAAFRSYKDTNIKGLGANLTFSVASWGANMWEGIKNFGCAIGNGCKSLVERIRS
jgi:hypothetical protein